MSRLLNALLDISKLESGGVKPEPATVPVAELLAAMEREFRGIAETIGLELEASSEVGKGSTFSIRLRESVEPAAAPSTQFAAAAALERQTGRASIVLVGDDPDVRNATRMLLRADGYEVMAVGSLAEALQKLQNTRGIDLLITDFHLADGETGVQVISRLRQQLDAALKAILITGDTSSAVKQLSRDSHLRVVSKPVHAEEFLKVVQQLLAA